MTKNNSTINEKGSEAYIKMVEGQIQAYEMENKKIPTVKELVDGKYLVNSEGPAGKTIQISTEGVVTLVDFTMSMKNQKGFTLIEILFVFSVFLVIASISTIIITSSIFDV